MNISFIFINAIYQKDEYRFTIEWTDGKISHYRLSDLQRRCSCARCRLTSHRDVDEHVKAVVIASVGRYALQIEFTSGCSRGIYSFEFLRLLD